MNSSKVLGRLALLGAVVAIGAWALLALLGDGDAGAGELREGGAAAATPSVGAAGVDLPAPEPVSVSRESVGGPESAGEELAPAIPESEIDRDLHLHGRVIDLAASPVAGARIEVLLPPAREFSVLDREYHAQVDPFAELRSDRDGRFAVALDRGRPVDLKVSAAGFAVQWVPNRFAGEQVEIVLDQGCTLSGRITRAADGAPVEGVKVRVFRLGGPSTVSFRTATDAIGEYRIDGLPPRGMELEVVPERERAPNWIDVEFGADGTQVKDVVLEDGIVVRGRVTDAATGAPIAGAEIGEGWTFRRVARTGADGRYELHGFGSPGVPDLHVRAEGYGKRARRELPPPVDGVIEHDWALPRAHRASGRVLDSRGSPVAEAYVAAVASEFVGDGQLTDWPSTRTGADGRFVLPTLIPALRHALFVRKRGLATVVYDFPLTELTEPDLDLGDVVQPPAAILLGRVIDDAGTGIPDVPVSLRGCNADRSRLVEGKAKGAAGHYVDSRSARTDDLGRFSFADLPAGEFRLSAAVRGRPQSVGPTIHIAEGETHEGTEIVMPRGGTIAGRVVTESGAGVRGIYVRVHSDDGASDGFSCRSDVDGRFEIDGLAEGEYGIECRPDFVELPDERALLLPASLSGVAVGTTDVRIELRAGVLITGTLLDESGAPLDQGMIEGGVSGSDERFWATSDRAGRFDLVVPARSLVDLRVRRTVSGRALEELGTLAAGVLAGTTDVVLRVPAAAEQDE